MPCYRASRTKRPATAQDTRWQPSQDDFELLLDMLFRTRIICFPTKEERVEMASRLSVTERQVQVWCQNKRQKLRESGIGYSDTRAPALVIAERGKIAPANMSVSPAPVSMPPPSRRKSHAPSEATESCGEDDAEYVPRSTRTRPYAVPRTRPISPIELPPAVHSERRTPPPPRRSDPPRHESPASLPDLLYDDDAESLSSELESPPPSRNRRLSVAEITTPTDHEPRMEIKAPSWVWALDPHASSWSFQDRLHTWAQNRFPEADLRSGRAGSEMKRVW